MLEMIEYAMAATEAKEKAKLSDRPERIRTLFWMHRFHFMTWLLQNGVSIPPHLLIDQSHPKVGSQSVDSPVETPSEENPQGN
jgi:hypothetical protein